MWRAAPGQPLLPATPRAAPEEKTQTTPRCCERPAHHTIPWARMAHPPPLAPRGARSPNCRRCRRRLRAARRPKGTRKPTGSPQGLLTPAAVSTAVDQLAPAPAAALPLHSPLAARPSDCKGPPIVYPLRSTTAPPQSVPPPPFLAAAQRGGPRPGFPIATGELRPRAPAPTAARLPAAQRSCNVPRRSADVAALHTRAWSVCHAPSQGRRAEGISRCVRRARREV
jgi:hypothetical protein